MKIRRVGWVVLLAVLVLPLVAKDKFVQSKLTPAPLQVDAKIDEWTPDEILTEEKVGAKFAVRNDASYLYIMLSLDDPKYQSTVDQSGITFWIYPELKDKKTHGLHFYKKTVTADELIKDLENQGQTLTAEKKAEFKARPQYQIFTCDSVNKKGEVVPHPNLSASATYRLAQVQKSKVFEFVVPIVMLDDPVGEMKIDPAKPFKFGMEWGGMTEQMKKERAAQLGDRGSQVSAAGASDTITGEGGDFRAPGGSLTAMRTRPNERKFEFWFDLKIAPNL